MGMTAKRKVLIQKDSDGRVKSKALSIPTELETGEYHTMAASALILSDPTGSLSKGELAELLESIESIYWQKKIQKETNNANQGDQ